VNQARDDGFIYLKQYPDMDPSATIMATVGTTAARDWEKAVTPPGMARIPAPTTFLMRLKMDRPTVTPPVLAPDSTGPRF